MTLLHHDISSLDGKQTTLGEVGARVMLLVNVASKCGLTPQYAGLESLHERYADKGFSVVGFPCNQFLGQEPGTAEEIATFCSTTYGITFPMMEKIDVNGDTSHPIYAELHAVVDAEGHAGDIRWNFEKFLVSSDGKVLARFAPMTAPDDPTIVSAIEAALGEG
jgi:glutathione peroxidase